MGSPIVVMIWNVVFANKCRSETWMDLDETWQVRLRPEKTKPCTFPAKSRYGFWREREKMGRRGIVFAT